jgi:hypothetical protein
MGVEPVEVVVSSDVQVVVTWRGLIGVGLRAGPKAADVRVVTDLISRARRPRIALVHLLGMSSLAPLDEGARAAYDQMMRAPDPKACCSAVLLPDEGFGAAIVRSAISGLTLITRTTFPTRAFGRAEDACAWIAESMNRAGASCGTASEIGEAVADLRQHLSEHGRSPLTVDGSRERA